MCHPSPLEASPLRAILGQIPQSQASVSFGWGDTCRSQRWYALWRRWHPGSTYNQDSLPCPSCVNLQKEIQNLSNNATCSSCSVLRCWKELLDFNPWMSSLVEPDVMDTMFLRCWPWHSPQVVDEQPGTELVAFCPSLKYLPHNFFHNLALLYLMASQIILANHAYALQRPQLVNG